MSEISFSVSILASCHYHVLMQQILIYVKDPVNWTNGGSWIATPTPPVNGPIARWPLVH